MLIVPFHKHFGHILWLEMTSNVEAHGLLVWRPQTLPRPVSEALKICKSLVNQVCSDTIILQQLHA